MYCPKCATLQSDDQKFCRACGLNLEIIAEIITDESNAGKFNAVSGAKAWHKKRKNRLENLGGLTIMLSLLIGCLIPLVIGLSYLIAFSAVLLESLILILSGVAGIMLFGGISLAIYGDMSKKAVKDEDLPKALNHKNIGELASADNFEPVNSPFVNATRKFETNKINLGK